MSSKGREMMDRDYLLVKGATAAVLKALALVAAGAVLGLGFYQWELGLLIVGMCLVGLALLAMDD